MDFELVAHLLRTYVVLVFKSEESLCSRHNRFGKDHQANKLRSYRSSSAYSFDDLYVCTVPCVYRTTTTPFIIRLKCIKKSDKHITLVKIIELRFTQIMLVWLQCRVHFTKFVGHFFRVKVHIQSVANGNTNRVQFIITHNLLLAVHQCGETFCS